MVQQAATAIENNFTKGLLTEFTGLNFPANAATDTDNCTYTLVGDVTRRLGIDFEENYMTWSYDRDTAAVNTYKWNNAGGDGNTQVMVVQINGFLRFWRSDLATPASPLSTHILASAIDLSTFGAAGGTFNKTLECQFSSGNGYLFVYHPGCDPFYCEYNAGTITPHLITINIRDFNGVPETTPVNVRPTASSVEHNYNLLNQGWVSGNPWQGSDAVSTIVVGLGSKTFVISSGLPITLGDAVTIFYNGSAATIGAPPVGTPVMSGTVTAYAGTSLTVNVDSGSTGYFGTTMTGFLINPRNIAYLNTWNAAIGNFPSNADVWWYFKNKDGVFDPATTINYVTLSAGNAPRGHYVLNAFSQRRDLASNLNIQGLITTARPRTGCWFQGRVWYAGVDSQQPVTGDAGSYTWTENLYFSQVVRTSSDLGNCYQVNDPTSEKLFDLLPTDGGVIQIQGCGSVHKLFPIQNGLLVFAANGIWFITGSQGIGFSANDYTVSQVSSVRSISGTSFVNVLGYPYFWNEEGIYSVQPAKSGGLSVDPITVGTIQTFYDSIPAPSKKYVRGDYHPIDYTIQWIYRGSYETGLVDRYQFNKILNYNTYNKAFFPYSTSVTHVTINGINYVSSPGGSSAPDPAFKYLTTSLVPFALTWSDEHDERYRDWMSDSTPGGGTDYESYFITGFRIAGSALNRFQMPYLYTFSRNDTPTSFKIQGIWDYANTGNSGRWSTAQLINNWGPNFSTLFRRHRIRGRGLVLQIKVTSVTGQPFDIMGWSMPLQINAST